MELPSTTDVRQSQNPRELRIRVMVSLIYDTTAGVLKTDIVWNLSTASFGDRQRPLMYCNWVDGKDEGVYGCPANARHETAIRCTEMVIDLFGDKHVPYEIPMANHG